MTRFLVINGPNLNLLGSRSPDIYGVKSLAEIEDQISRKAAELGVGVDFFQSNSEGTIIDYIQGRSREAQGIVINPGALTHYGYSLRDALVDSGLPVVEVHLTNIHAREQWRRHSVIADIVTGRIAGLGWMGYLAALDGLTTLVPSLPSLKEVRSK